MLEIRKNVKIIKLEKISRENFPGISWIPKIFGISEISRNSREIFWKLTVFRSGVK